MAIAKKIAVFAIAIVKFRGRDRPAIFWPNKWRSPITRALFKFQHAQGKLSSTISVCKNSKRDPSVQNCKCIFAQSSKPINIIITIWIPIFEPQTDFRVISMIYLRNISFVTFSTKNLIYKIIYFSSSIKAKYRMPCHIFAKATFQCTMVGRGDKTYFELRTLSHTFGYVITRKR